MGAASALGVSWRCRYSGCNGQRNCFVSARRESRSGLSTPEAARFEYPEKAIRIMTPEMPEDNYTLLIEVTGIMPVWTDKTKAVYGSDNSFVTVDSIYYF